MKIEQNIPLAPYTTFKIGGDAKFFCVVKNVEELKEAVEAAQNQNLKILILGGGSNVLVSDEGFDGMVIKIDFRGVEFKESGAGVNAHVAAGENWDEFVSETVRRGLYGLENLSGVPGSVGGTPVQNIGAYGAEVKDAIESVEVFDMKKSVVRELSNADCHFEYRESFFKTPVGRNLVILSVTFRLSKDGTLRADYKDVKKYAEEHGEIKTLADMRKAILEIRSKKFPDIKKHGTAGSFFKNPIISKKDYEALLPEFPKLPSFEAGEGKVKIPAGYLLDVLCGFKGYRKGDAGVFENQALVLVNWGKAEARHILELAEEMRQKVKELTGINLEFEVNVL